MQRNASTYLVCLAALALTLTGRATAQEDIEGGATEPNPFEASGSASASTSSGARLNANSDGPGASDGLRIGIQLRLDALNALGPLDSTAGGAETIGRRLLVPLVAPGVRFLDHRLFLGLGLGLHGWSREESNGDESSRSGFGLSPLLTYDVLRDNFAALHLLAAFNFASLGETESCDSDGMCVDGNDDTTGVGLTLGAGVRGLIGPGLALGAEFGWGFLSTSSDADDSVFVHGLFGALIVEASVGI